MKPQNQLLAAHLARALARYVPEATREAKASGSAVPSELVNLAEFFADCARPRQDATWNAVSPPTMDAAGMTNRLLLTKREAASLLAVSVRQLERLVAGDAIRTVRVGGGVRVRRADLDAYVAGLAAPASSFRGSVTAKDQAS
ncbi:excisionase family DNA-binding protein [Nocardioides nanhaiensis]|uniref:Helix-turn-helix domain-containing protein n=1 Tax=Nocardioides nanhaiensis TaxID=1476871 RepID=A0ABP8WZ93_9ACTN